MTFDDMITRLDAISTERYPVITDLDIKALKMAINKVLEQKSILEKIKSEIVNASYTHYFEFGEYIGEDSKAITIVNLNDIEQIFDKYNIEREE